MRAGEFRHRIYIEQPVLTQSASGEMTPNWVPFATVWAKIKPLHGREALVANQPLAALDTQIGIRWSPFLDQISESWRIKHNLVVYEIKSIAHIDLAQREIEMQCKSGVAGG